MGIVDRLRQEFDVVVEWLGFEIHPETPQGGRPLAELFPHADADAMAARLNSRGSPLGIAFRKVERIANSRLSLEASEFAKEQGRFDAFHRAVFRAYFSEGRDIGSIEVLAQIARDAGLDAANMRASLRTGRHGPLLEKVKNEAARLGVAAAPTFLINGRDRIVGAQPLEVFREKLRTCR